MRQHLLRTSYLRKTGSMALHQHRTSHILLANTKNLAKLIDRTGHERCFR